MIENICQENQKGKRPLGKPELLWKGRINQNFSSVLEEEQSNLN